MRPWQLLQALTSSKVAEGIANLTNNPIKEPPSPIAACQSLIHECCTTHVSQVNLGDWAALVASMVGLCRRTSPAIAVSSLQNVILIVPNILLESNDVCGSATECFADSAMLRVSYINPGTLRKLIDMRCPRPNQ